jgi:hypothetical protein
MSYAPAYVNAIISRAQGWSRNLLFCCSLFGSENDRPLGSPYRSGRSRHWIKSKNPQHPAVKREADEDWGKAALAMSVAPESGRNRIMI